MELIRKDVSVSLIARLPQFTLFYGLAVGFLSDFHIESASLTPYGEGDTHPADWVETCKYTIYTSVE